MASTEKVDKVARLKERIDSSEALLLADYRGLTTSDVMELRRSLVSADTSFAVVKNTLMKRAVEESGISEVSGLLEGPTAVGFVEGDAVAAAKQLVDAARRYPALELKGAWVEGRLLGPEEAQTLATLESREAMLSKVAGLAKAEMSKAAAMFQTLQGRFVGLLEAYRDKLPAEETPSEPAETAAEAPAEPADAAATAAEEPAGTPSETSEPAAETSEPAAAATTEAANGTGEASAESEAERTSETPTETQTETETTEQEPAPPEGEE
ncbi:MAG: 50S ribosomal protein L10 [Actinomycetota bacterium]